MSHVADARKWLKAAVEPSDLPAMETSVFVGVAQVHATLALVEQQRLANLIALSTELDSDAQDALYAEGYELRPEVKAALGVTS